METRTIFSKLETREEEGRPPIVEGHFAVFDVETEIAPRVFERIARGAFDEALKDDVRALVNHDSTLVLGRNRAGTVELAIDGKGLFGRIHINRLDSDAMNLFQRVRRGDVTQCSFGFDILDKDSDYRADGSVHFVLRKLKLYEISPCTFPAYPDTGIEARAAEAARIRDRAFELWRENQKRRIEKWR